MKAGCRQGNDEFKDHSQTLMRTSLNMHVYRHNLEGDSDVVDAAPFSSDPCWEYQPQIWSTTGCVRPLYI